MIQEWVVSGPILRIFYISAQWQPTNREHLQTNTIQIYAAQEGACAYSGL